MSMQYAYKKESRSVFLLPVMNLHFRVHGTVGVRLKGQYFLSGPKVLRSCGNRNETLQADLRCATSLAAV